MVELTRTLTSTLELPEILRIVLDRMKSLTQAEALSLMLYDPERDELVFAATETLRENAIVGFRLPPSRSLASWVARSGESAVVNDVRGDPRFYPEIDRVTRFTTRNLLSVPLVRLGRVIGVLEVANRHGGGDYDDGDRARLESLALEIGADCDPETLCLDAEAMRGLLARAVTTAPSEAAALLLLDPAGHELVFRASRTIESGVIDGMRLPASRGIAGWVARNRQAVRLDDVASDPRHFAGVGEQTGLAPRTMICVPMVSKDTLRGVIQILNKVDDSTFTEAELSLAQTLADHAAIAIENASLYRQAYVASITDDLTGLGNTRHFHRSLADAMTRGRPVSLVILDLDNFKAVVDRYGHLAGSRSIAQIGRDDRAPRAAGRRPRALRRRRVRDRAPGHGHGGGAPSRGVGAEGDRGLRAARERGRRSLAGHGERRGGDVPASRLRRGEPVPAGRRRHVLGQALGQEQGVGGAGSGVRGRCVDRPGVVAPGEAQAVNTTPLTTRMLP